LKILSLGCGDIGSVIAQEPAEKLDEAEITVAQRNRERAKASACARAAIINNSFY
jgi:saccharopine dehydrogenase-like NADP-dependent oxidoreductase